MGRDSWCLSSLDKRLVTIVRQSEMSLCSNKAGCHDTMVVNHVSNERTPRDLGRPFIVILALSFLLSPKAGSREKETIDMSGD